MATALEKIEQELVTLMGDTGRSALQRSLKTLRRGANGNMAFFNRVALVQELTQVFSIFMTDDQVVRFKLKLLNIKGDEEE